MLSTPILVVLFWAVVMIAYGSFRAPLPIAYRVQASILTLFLVYNGARTLDVLLWGVFNPHAFVIFYQKSSVFFSSQVAVAIATVSLLAGPVTIFIGFWIAQRKLKGFNWAVRCAPFLLALTLLNVTRIIGAESFRNHAWDAQKTSFVSVFSIVSYTVFYFWLSRFAKSPKNRQFIIQSSRLTEESAAKDVTP